MVNSAEVIQALVTAIFDEAFPAMPEASEAGFGDGGRRLVTIGELLRASAAWPAAPAARRHPASLTTGRQPWPRRLFSTPPGR